jgi:hypothetical protein
MQNNPTTRRKSKQTKDLLTLSTKFQEIIFRPADKNLGLVAIHLQHYNELVMEHLTNHTNYMIASSSQFEEGPLLRYLIDKFKMFITKTPWYSNEKPLTQHQYDFKFPNFHVLPKLHKSGRIKGRPIAGQVNWITTPISIILDNRLQKHLHLFPNILKNSLQLVNDLELFNQSTLASQIEDIWIITGDIESLYPNMKLNKLYTIIEELDFELSPLVDFVCRHSYVKYFGKIYKQLDGIPMGTNAAVSMANVYVGSIIDRYIDSRPQTIYYRRYIDDLFILWKGDLKLWERAAANINRLHSSIKVNFDLPSQSSVNFLDITISKNIRLSRFETTIFQKPLNKYNYISPSSCHEPHMFSGFIKGELTRYARLSSTAYSYNFTKKLFYQRLLDRGYKRLHIRPIFNKHRWSVRFNQQPTCSKKIIPFVIPYTLRRNAAQLKHTIKDYEEQFQKYLDHSKTLVVYSKRRNIMDILCPSSLSRSQCKILASNRFIFSRKQG